MPRRGDCASDREGGSLRYSRFEIGDRTIAGKFHLSLIAEHTYTSLCRTGGISMQTQSAKAATFKVLHERAQPFVIPNPWDRGSALLLESLGFEALATTSLGLAN